MAKEKKENGRSFMKDFRAELKKVVWPTSKQMVNNVTAVIVIVLVTAAIVFVLDLAFSSINKYGLDKLKSKVQSNVVTTIDNSSTSDENNTENNENAENKENPQPDASSPESAVNENETSTDENNSGATEPNVETPNE